MLLLTACGPAATAVPAAEVAVEAKPVRVAVVMPSAITDMAFSQSMYSALVAVQKEMGGEGKMEIKKFDPVVRQHVMYKETKLK